MNKPCILVVDDQSDNRALLTLMLERSGYAAAEASDGATAFALVKANPPDLILLDVVMPGMDGLELTTRLRSDPSLPFIPIILITAQHGLDLKIDGLEAGADDFLAKPVQMRELLAKVRALLRLKQAQDALVEERNKTSLLYRIQQQLTSSLDIDDVIRDTLQLTIDAVGAAQGTMLVFDRQGKLWRQMSAYRPDGQRELVVVTTQADERELNGLAAQTGLAHWIDEARSNHLSMVAVPLQHADTTLGLLTLTHPKPHHFTPTQMDLLRAAGVQISTALHNASLYGLLRDAERSREQFLHLLTHDLRGPLAGIAGCLHLLEQRVHYPEDKLYVDLAQTACRTQEQIIDDMLDVYRAEGTQLELRRVPVRLDALGADVERILSGMALEQDTHLRIDLPASPPVEVDRDKIKRVLLNLVGNALKFTAGGHVSVMARVDGDVLHVEVRDTGVGIPPEQLDRIWDRFFQGGQRGARRGTGLGLFFCREVVRAHGGRIWAESTLGVGTTLHCTLPIYNSEEIHEQVADFSCRR